MMYLLSISILLCVVMSFDPLQANDLEIKKSTPKIKEVK